MSYPPMPYVIPANATFHTVNAMCRAAYFSSDGKFEKSSGKRLEIAMMKATLLVLYAQAVLSLTHPVFTPYDTSLLAETSYFEQFDYSDLSESKWVVSKSKKGKEYLYSGQWTIEPAKEYPGFANDTALVMKSPASHYAISYKFDQPFDNTNNTLVLQYEIKTQVGLTCGGSYIKLLNEGFDQNTYNDATPFQLMFGPDRCGSNDKVHFIINRFNPITKQYQEKHLTQSPLSKNTYVSTLYTVIVKPNSDFEIRVNGGVAKAGNLLEKPHLLSPRLNPPKEIKDILAKKPDDWDDLEFIEDESIQKPEDYDAKYASPFIDDPSVSKPEGWLDDEPEFIYDPYAKRPDLWDDKEDGEWERPVIPNPKCTVGCGEWQAPKIANPNYKGIWVQPTIENPNYKGEWENPMIPNPDYYEDKNPSNLEPIGGIGFELWTVQPEVSFDNIYLGHSIEEAETIGNETFLPKFELELKSYELNKPKAGRGPVAPPSSFDDIIDQRHEVESISEIITFFVLIMKREFLSISDFWYAFNREPFKTLSLEPLKALVYLGVVLFGFTIFFGIVNVIVFLGSNWARESRKAIEDAKLKAGINNTYSNDDPNSVPRIVEITDENELKELNAKASSAQTKITKASRRKH